MTNQISIGENSFVIETTNATQEDLDELIKILNDAQDEQVQQAKELAKELGCSIGCAFDVQYFRTRGRWTQEAENELIRRDKAGEPASNMSEYA